MGLIIGVDLPVMSIGELAAVVMGGVTVGTTMFHVVLWLGKLTNKVDRHEDKLNDHERDIRELKGMGV